MGSINFTVEVGSRASKGDEMGYFAFGGSTTIALFQKGALVIDADLVSNRYAGLSSLRPYASLMIMKYVRLGR